MRPLTTRREGRPCWRRTRLAEQRRRLPPGPVVEKNYRFRDENGDEVGLAELFGHHATLVTYFWMFGPQRERACPMCTNFLGGANANGADVKQRVAFKSIGRSPVIGNARSPSSAVGVTSISFRQSAMTTHGTWA